LGSGKNLGPIKDRVVQSDGEDGETETSRPSQEFVRRIIQFVLGIVEGVNVEIELDPVAFLFPARARAHPRGRFDYDIANFKQGSIFRQNDHEQEHEYQHEGKTQTPNIET